MTFKSPLSVSSMVDQAVERLETAIMTGELPAGSKISEQVLADAFGISRAPLREAIRRLEGRKLVQRTPYVGARVVDLSQKDIIEIFAVREALEGMSARLAAEHITAKELRELRVALDPHGETGSSEAETYQRFPDLDFHYRIAMASRNDRLIDLLCGDLYYLLRVYRYRSTRQPGRLKQGRQEHRAIYDAIAASDPEAAEAAMRRHLRNGREALIQDFQASQPATNPVEPSRRKSVANKQAELPLRKKGKHRQPVKG